MKKYLTILLCLLMFSSTAACAEENKSDETDKNGQEQVSAKYDKILVVYFSRTGYNYPNQWLDVGHTARVAGFIKELTGADSFEIVPVIPYPDDYEETKTISTNERNNDLRPEFKGEIEDIEKYDLIFIGGPVWYGGMPMIIHTFYDKYAKSLDGKTIAPFSTHAGSGLADAASLARSYCPESDVLAGLAVQGTNSMNSKEDVRNWLLRIGVLEESSDLGTVNAIRCDTDSSPVYYSLNGLPVNKPANGVYVWIKDGKTRKISL